MNGHPISDPGRSSWDPAQYLRYAEERARPCWDLVARVPVTAPDRVVDLGCGPGTVTAGLAAHWPSATVAGIDRSPAMIARAQDHADPPRLTFAVGDCTTWEPAPGGVDVVFANAVLQWVPGHLDLFPRWLGWLRPGGALAFQVPGNFAAPSHALLRKLAMSRRWRNRFRSLAGGRDVHEPIEYLERLRALGTAVDVWETTYYHRLAGTDPVLQWVRGTALGPYRAAFDGDGRALATFEAAYAEALRAAYPPGRGGETVFPFRRVFVVASAA